MEVTQGFLWQIVAVIFMVSAFLLYNFISFRSPFNYDSKSGIWNEMKESGVQNHSRKFLCRNISCSGGLMTAVEFPPSSQVVRGPLSKGLPLLYPWLSYPSMESIRLEDQNGSLVALTLLGRFLGDGDYVWTADVKKPGYYRLYAGKVLLKIIPMSLNSMVCRNSPKDFESLYSCNKDDLLQVQKMGLRWQVKKVPEDAYNNPNLPHFVIVNNTLYKKPGDGSWFDVYLKWFRYLLRKVQLPDVEFVFNTVDSPVVYDLSGNPPTLQICHRDYGSAIAVPSAEHLSDIQSGAFIKSAVGRPASWKDSTPKCYYRGDNALPKNWVTGDKVDVQGRFLAAMAAKNRPDILDVKIRLQYAGLLEAGEGKRLTEMGLVANLTREEEEAERKDYMCTLSMDANCLKPALGRKLVEGGVVLMQDSPLVGHYSHLLQDGVNVVKVDYFFSDLVEKAEGVIGDPRSERIALNAFSLGMTRLKEEDMLCWLMYTLVELSSKSERVFVREGMAAVSDDEQSFEECL